MPYAPPITPGHDSARVPWLPAIALPWILSAGCSAIAPRAPLRASEDDDREATLIAYAIENSGDTPLYEDGEFDVEGWGLELQGFDTDPGLLAGYQNRELGPVEDYDEYYAGGIYSFDEAEFAYVMGAVRYGRGIEFAGESSDDYWGWTLGGGLRVELIDNVWLDARVMYEWLLDPVTVRLQEQELEGWLGTLGIGVSF